MKIRAQQVTGLGSIVINVLPFLVYPLLITQQNGAPINFLPFAIYYAFRRSGLILFRDWEHDYPALGKMGLLWGISGATLGLFGNFSPIFWDLSSVGTGLASVLLPTAVNQNKRVLKEQAKNKKQSSSRELLIQLMIMIGILAIVAGLRWAPLNFAILLVANILVLEGSQYWHQKISLSSKMHWSNYLLGAVLFLAMFAMRVGRSVGIGQPITWGLILLAVFLSLITVLLVINWQGTVLPTTYHRQAVFYGVCGQYWSMYSTIFIGVLYGIGMYYWVIVAYLVAILFGKPFARLLHKWLPVDQLTLALVMTSVGIALTFWLPTYFGGIFLIRTFANQIRGMAIDDYERVTHNYDQSYITNYYYSTIGGLVSQLVMWGSLFILARSQELGNILTAFVDHRTNPNAALVINGAHLILAVYMIMFILWLLVDRLRLLHPQNNGDD